MLKSLLFSNILLKAMRETKLILLCGQDAAIDSGGRVFWSLDDIPKAAEGAALVRRFAQEGLEYEARECGEDLFADARVCRIPIRRAAGELEAGDLRALFTARGLLTWFASAKYCGACAHELRDIPPGLPDESAGRRCPACGRVVFPRISPAVIVLVRREGKVLLARHVRAATGYFGLIAGFVETGESLEMAARRELREEAGIEVRDLRYRRSQPWPFPDSLMLGFTAEWASGEARADGVEIAELRWCDPRTFPNLPMPGSIARALVDDFGLGTL